MTEEIFIRFVLDHEDEDSGRLLFSADRWPDIDVRRAARIIEARRKIREKVPSWYAHPELDYPGSLPLEQCSSEATARYKQSFVPRGGRIADLTGGLGVDCWFLSRQAAEAHYCERSAELCAAARHNFAALGGHIAVHEGDGIAWLQEQTGCFDLIYLDPARRGKAGQRVYDIAGCEPNLLEIKDLLLSHAHRVLAKVSPMADITRTLAQLPETRELHVVATGGEVKELLILLTRESTETPLIVAADDTQRFSFTPAEEHAATVSYAETIGEYLFLPSKAVRKAGAFRLLSERFDLAKLAPSTHLYTAPTTVEGFPGKTYVVEDVLPWGNAAQRELRRRFDRLELATFNFPMSTDALRRRLGIPGGGGHYIAATALNNERILIICKI